MKKIFSLIKANMSDGINIFKISTKKKNGFTKIVLPILLFIIIMGAFYSYADQIIQKLKVVNMEFVVLSLFVIFTSILTIIEGIYKSGNLLFNCKDDNLLFSLPVKKQTILFIRLFKFYVFELIYNSLFLIPAIIAYAVYVKPNITYYLVSIIGILLFPIIPIIISCVFGSIISFISSRFKAKNKVQTILTFVFLLGVMYLSFNFENILTNLANNAESINDFITKLYYPAGVYVKLVLKFSVIKLIEFIIVNIVLLYFTILFVGKIYFRINSGVKSIKINKHNTNYIIKSSTPVKAMIKKEFNRFINSTVFITNAGFGLILHIVGCILLIVKFNKLSNLLIEMKPDITIEYLKNSISLIIFALICFSSFMTSITSSMISLEGKSINILKSLPIKPYTIIKSKVLSAVLIMYPFIFVGDIIVFIAFKLDILSILLLLLASIICPLLSETIGILVNLKYPKMDARNDTEVVKQSISSMISVFIGMGLLALTMFLLFKALVANIPNNLIILSFILAYTIIYIILLIILQKTSENDFNKISI